MPIELKKKSAAKTDEDANKASGLTLFQEDSAELTLPGETIAAFLDTCDYTAVAESEEAIGFLTPAEVEPEDADEADEDEDEGEDDADDADASETCDALLPGIVAARLVDEADLTDMFGHYLDRMAAEIDESDEAQLQEQAALACFAEYRDEDGGIAEDHRETVAALLLTVLEGSMVATEVSERILSKSQRLQSARKRRKPKSGAVRAKLKKRRREEGRGAKKQKITRQHKMRSRKKASRIKQLARESTDENILMFGFGEGIEGANFKVALAKAPDMQFDEATVEVLIAQCGALDEMKMKCSECGEEYESKDESDLDEKSKIPPQFLSKKKGKKGDDDDDADDKGKKGKKDEADIDEMKEGVCPKCTAKKDKKGKKDESVRSGSAFAAPVGRPSLDEGASLAARTLGTMGRGRKTINEDKE